MTRSTSRREGKASWSATVVNNFRTEGQTHSGVRPVVLGVLRDGNDNDNINRRQGLSDIRLWTMTADTRRQGATHAENTSSEPRDVNARVVDMRVTGFEDEHLVGRARTQAVGESQTSWTSTY